MEATNATTPTHTATDTRRRRRGIAVDGDGRAPVAATISPRPATTRPIPATAARTATVRAGRRIAPVPTTTRMAPRTARVRFVLGVFAMHLQPRAAMPARPTVEVRADTATSITAPASTVNPAAHQSWPASWRQVAATRAPCRVCSSAVEANKAVAMPSRPTMAPLAVTAQLASRRPDPGRGRSPLRRRAAAGPGAAAARPADPRTGSDGGARRRNRAPLPTSR